LGYGLAAFWLTPSFIGAIAFNWPKDAFNYHFLRQQAMLLAALPLIVLLLRLLLARVAPGQYYLWFITLSFFGFAWIVLWYYSTGVDTIPESRRYALEMEMFLLLLVFEVFRQTLRTPSRRCVSSSSTQCSRSSWPAGGQIRTYCTQGFASRRPSPVDGTIERRVAERLAALQSKWPRIRLRWSSFPAEFVVRNSPGGWQLRIRPDYPHAFEPQLPDPHQCEQHRRE